MSVCEEDDNQALLTNHYSTAKLQNDREREKQAMQQQIAAEVAKQTAHLREQFKQLKASAVTTQQATNFTSTEAVKDLIKADKIRKRITINDVFKYLTPIQ